MKNQNFQYDYRGCVAKMKYEDGFVFISVYDKQEKVNYSNIESYDPVTVTKSDLIEKAQVIIDDIRDNDWTKWVNMVKDEFDGICVDLAKLLVRLEGSIKILKKVMETCQENNAICPYCFKNLSEEEHDINCEFRIIIDEYGSGE